jgi:hypothetical protein
MRQTARGVKHPQDLDGPIAHAAGHDVPRFQGNQFPVSWGSPRPVWRWLTRHHHDGPHNTLDHQAWGRRVVAGDVGDLVIAIAQHLAPPTDPHSPSTSGSAQRCPCVARGIARIRFGGCGLDLRKLPFDALDEFAVTSAAIYDLLGWVETAGRARQSLNSSSRRRAMVVDMAGWASQASPVFITRPVRRPRW